MGVANDDKSVLFPKVQRKTLEHLPENLEICTYGQLLTTIRIGKMTPIESKSLKRECYAEIKLHGHMEASVSK